MTKCINMVYERFADDGSPLSNNYNLNFSIETNITPHFYSRLPRVKFYSAEALPEESFLYELNWDYNKSHQGYFDEVLADGNIRDSVLRRIREKTAFVLFTVLHEGWVNDQFLSTIESNFRKAGIPLSQIIYASNCFNGDQLYQEYCKKYNVVPELKLEYCPTFRIDKTDVEQVVEEKQYVFDKKKKTFLCFNRRFSDHRLMLYMLIEKNNLLDDCYLSMSKVQPESSNNFLTNATYLTQRYPTFGISNEDLVRSDSKLPLILDNPNFNRYPMEDNPFSMEKYYDESLVNIVNETYFFNNIIHITEKTYKPIAFMQPFIMVAAPFSLKHIQDVGFKTFDKFWDESYDLETDHVSRMNKIVDLIKQISKWSDDEKMKFIQESMSILEHNKNHLNTMKHIEMDIITEKYGC